MKLSEAEIGRQLKITTVRGEVRALHGEVKFSVSATTRAPREGEQDGVDYYFLTKEEFERSIAENALVEHACYCENYYGTLRSELGSMASTASLWPSDATMPPAASMKVDLPAPGTPVIPTRIDLPE